MERKWWPVYSVEQLSELLHNFAQQEPRVLILEVPSNGAQFFIGMSKGLGGIRVYPFRSTGYCWSAKPNKTYSTSDFWITCEGEPSLFRAAYMMPILDIIQMIVYIVENDDLPNEPDWVNLQGERLPSLWNCVYPESDEDFSE